jgi:hypothetical protein
MISGENTDMRILHYGMNDWYQDVVLCSNETAQTSSVSTTLILLCLNHCAWIISEGAPSVRNRALRHFEASRSHCQHTAGNKIFEVVFVLNVSLRGVVNTHPRKCWKQKEHCGQEVCNRLLLISRHNSGINMTYICTYHVFRYIAAINGYIELLQLLFFFLSATPSYARWESVMQVRCLFNVCMH